MVDWWDFGSAVMLFVDRSEEQVELIEAYLKATKQLRDYSDDKEEPVFSQIVSLDLSTVVSSVSGPKRPNDRVSVSEMKDDFLICLTNKVSVVLFDPQKITLYTSILDRLQSRAISDKLIFV